MSARTSDKLPRINLRKANLTKLSISARLPWDENTRAIFGDLLVSNIPGQLRAVGVQYFDEQGDEVTSGFVLLSAAKYRRNGQDHAVTETARLGHLGSYETLNVQITYTSNSEIPQGKVPEMLRRERELVVRLLRFEDPLLFEVRGEFSFPAKTEEDLLTVFPLPTRLTAENDARVFDEIRGIRGVKLSQDNKQLIEYQFVLDRPSNRNVYITINFSIESVMTEALFSDALARSISLARNLIAINDSRVNS